MTLGIAECSGMCGKITIILTFSITILLTAGSILYWNWSKIKKRFAKEVKDEVNSMEDKKWKRK